MAALARPPLFLNLPSDGSRRDNWAKDIKTWSTYIGKRSMAAGAKKIFDADLNDRYAIIVRIGTILADHPEAGVSSLLHGPMLTDEKAEIESSLQLFTLARTAQEAARTMDAGDPLKSRMDRLVSYWTCASSLKGLERFFATGYPVLTARPLPDGSNIRQPTDDPHNFEPLELEYHLRRFLIRVLHYEGLVYTNDVDGRVTSDYSRVQAFFDLFAAARTMLEDELVDYTPIQGDVFYHEHKDPNYSHVEWIRDIRSTLLDALDTVAEYALRPRGRTLTALERLDNRNAEIEDRDENGLPPLTDAELRQWDLDNATGPPQPGLTDQEIVDFNLREGGPLFLDALINIVENALTQSPLSRLSIDLIRSEDEFERELAKEHIEDTLIDKQISALDETRAMPLGQHHRYTPRFMQHRLNEGGDLDRTNKFVGVVSRDMGIVNRHRRNWRVMRDWFNRRPWAQIYQLYNSQPSGADAAPSPTHSWLTNAISLFQANIHPFDLSPSVGTPSPSPTAYINILPKLFGFYPIDLSTTTTVHTAPLHNVTCRLCSLPFSGNLGFDSSILQMHCAPHHIFHLKCIFTYWDAEGKYLHRCPTCGDIAGLNYESVGLDPRSFDPHSHETFVHNPWAYHHARLAAPYLRHENKDIANAARTVYDVPAHPSHGAHDPVSAAASEYWANENALEAQMAAEPIKWEGAEFQPGVLASLRTVGLLDANAQALNEGARALGRGYMDRRVREGMEDVFDISGRRVLPAARYAPKVEQGVLRTQRRRRLKEARRLFSPYGNGGDSSGAGGGL